MVTRSSILAMSSLVLVLGVAAACGDSSSSSTTKAPVTTAAGTTAAPTTAAPTTAAATTATPTSAAASTTAAAPTTAAPGPLAGIAGDYKGTWNNTTFGSTGSVEFVITTTPGATKGSQVTFVVTLGGNVFGAAAPAAETFTGTVGDSGLQVTGTSAAFGHLVWSITNDGALSVAGDQVPGGRVTKFTATGTIANGKIAITYSVDLVGGQNAKGALLAARS